MPALTTTTKNKNKMYLEKRHLFQHLEIRLRMKVKDAMYIRGCI